MLFSLTFDDGRESQYTEFYPVIEKFGLKATFYVITNEINMLGKLSWDQLKDLYTHDNEIGSHTHTHPHLTEVSDERLDMELKKSWEILRSFSVNTLAYPAGYYDERVVDNARRYYSGARGYHPKDHGTNLGMENERFHLKVLITEDSFPWKLSFSKFRDVMNKIIRKDRRLWIIAAFHGRPGGTFRGIRTFKNKRLLPSIKKYAKYIGKPTVLKETMFPRREDAYKFEWLCECLASNEHVEVQTISQGIDTLMGWQQNKTQVERRDGAEA